MTGNKNSLRHCSICVNTKFSSLLSYNYLSLRLRAEDQVRLIALAIIKGRVRKTAFALLCKQIKICWDKDLCYVNIHKYFDTHKDRNTVSVPKMIGGGKVSSQWSVTDLSVYSATSALQSSYKFIAYLPAYIGIPLPAYQLYADVPLQVLASKLAMRDMYTICDAHNIFYTSRHVKRELLS